MTTTKWIYQIYDAIIIWQLHSHSTHARVNGVSFLCRSPSDSRIRAKTIYAVSRNQFRHELDGVHFEIQATDPDDMNLEVLRGRANRTWFTSEQPKMQLGGRWSDEAWRRSIGCRSHPGHALFLFTSSFPFGVILPWCLPNYIGSL
jgi:hypothetical protein